MTDSLPEILKMNKRNAKMSVSAQRKLAKLQQDLREGRRKSKDVLRDFTIAHYGLDAEEMEPKVRKLAEKVEWVEGNEVLVINEMEWYTSKGHSSCWTSGMMNHRLRLHRFGVSGKPMWDFNAGLVLPMMQYASLISTHIGFNQWQPQPSPIIVGASEIQYGVPHRSIGKLDKHTDTRKDLPDLWSSYNIGLSRVSEVEGKMELFTGSDAREWFEGSSEAWRRATLGLPAFYAEAKKVLETGLSPKDYEAKIKNDRYAMEQSLAERLYTKPTKRDTLAAIELEMHMHKGKLKQPRGATIDIPAMVKELAQEYKIKY